MLSTILRWALYVLKVYWSLFSRALHTVVLLIAMAIRALTTTGFRQKLFAWLLKTNPPPGPWQHDVVCPHISEVSGTVIDVGTGSGISLPCYAAHAAKIDRLILVEPNPEFKADLVAKAKDIGLGDKTEIVTAIPAEEGIADYVVSVHLLCSVDADKLDGLIESIGKVLKRGGEYRAIDHTAAPKGTWVRWAQDMIAPLWEVLEGDCKFLDMPKVYESRVAPLAHLVVTVKEFSYPFVPRFPLLNPQAKCVGVRK